MSDEIRAELSSALDANAARVRDAIRRELAKVADLEPDQRIQFEIDPDSLRVSFVATEEDIVPDEWLAESLPADWFERAGDAFDGWDEVVAEHLSAFIADAWHAAFGPARFSPAFAFFHGYHHRQYDLELRKWLTGKEFDTRWG